MLGESQNQFPLSCEALSTCRAKKHFLINYGVPEGDLSLDGRVDLLDPQTFTRDWMKQRVGLSGDLDGNGKADFLDFSILGQNGSSPPSSSASEQYNPRKTNSTEMKTPIRLTQTYLCAMARFWRHELNMKKSNLTVLGAGLVTLIALSRSNANAVPVTIDTAPPGLTIRVDGTNYIAPAVFDWVSGSPHSLEAPSPQIALDGHSRHVFNSWSDGGAQTNQIITPATGTSYTATFTYQYLLDVAVAPMGGGTVSNNPTGSWYDPGQVVSLTASTNAEYQFLFWVGVVNSHTNYTAQVTINGYRSVTAAFGPSTNLPAPPITINSRNNPAPGNILMATWDRNTPHKYSNYLFVLDNQGNILKYLLVNGAPFDFQQQPNGLWSYANGSISGIAPTPTDPLTHYVLDTNLMVIDSFQMKNGYQTDFHEFLLLPNGHAAMMSYTYIPFDMSAIVPGGRPNCTLVINILQEQDQNKNVVFEWRTLDHLAITDSDLDLTAAQVNFATLNAFELDNDGNYLASFRSFSEIMKISRTTGEVIWRWGSPRTQFSFVGEHAENAPYYFARQHDIRRLHNGNVSMFDNGEFHSPRYSRSVEYHLDEANRVATMVSEYRYPTTDIFTPTAGSAQAVPGGGYFIGYGFLDPTTPFQRQVVEYHADGTVALEISVPSRVGAYRARKLTGNYTPIIVSVSGLAAGQTYVFSQGSTNTGVALGIQTLGGSGNASAVANREPFAPLGPSFPGTAPRVLPVRVTITGSEIQSLAADVIFDAESFGFGDTNGLFGYVDPNQLTVYRRPEGGGTNFAPLATSYDSAAKQLRASTTELGEFIFGFPDAQQIPNPPILIAPPDQSTVNQELPVRFAWTPRGFARASHLQVATDTNFTQLVVDAPSLTEYRYTWSSASPNTTYFYRVGITNDGGQSEWTTAAFGTVPPFIRVTSPNGGEAWQRGRMYFIRWNANIAEHVNIDLYKGGAFLRNITANTGTGAYQWQAGLSLVPDGDYTIKISSVTNSALSSTSAAPFSIVDAPMIDTTSVIPLPGGGFRFGFTAPGAVGATLWGTIALSPPSWQNLGPLTVTGGSGSFTNIPPYSFYRVSVP